MDLTSISTVLSSIKTATDIAKVIKDSDVSLEKAESRLKLAELISTLADAKMDMTEVQLLLIEKDNEIRDFKEKLSTKGKTLWENPYYWLMLEDIKDGPYCQHCYDKNQVLIRLQGNGEGYWECKVCKNDYTDSSYNPSSMFIESLRWTPSAGQFGRAFKVCSSLFYYPSSCGLQGRRCAEV